MPLLVPILPLWDGQVAEPDTRRDGGVRVYAPDYRSLVVDYLQLGIEWIHFIDLDGQRAARPVQSCLVTELAVHKETMVSVEGGIRNWQHARMYLGQAVDLVYLGGRDQWGQSFPGVGQREVEQRVMYEVVLPQSAVDYPELGVDRVRSLASSAVIPVITGPLPLHVLVRVANMAGVELRRKLVVRAQQVPDLAAWHHGLRLTGGFIQAVMIDHGVLEPLGLAAAVSMALGA